MCLTLGAPFSILLSAQEAVKPIQSRFHVQRPFSLPEAALSFVVLIHLLILSCVQARDPLTKVGTDYWDLPGDHHPQCRKHRFNLWVRKIPWRRAWQPTPVFLPRKSHGQRSLASYSPRGIKEPDMTERLSMRASTGWLDLTGSELS